MIQPSAAEIQARLDAFLTSRLGKWPPTASLELRACDLRDLQRWDGKVMPFLGVESPEGTVITFSSSIFPGGAALDPLDVEDDLGTSDAHITIPARFGRPEMHFGRGVFRYIEEFVDLPDVGEWCHTDDLRLPEWLRPFNGGVLVHWADDGSYAAGVGLKQHNDLGTEISVGTDPAHRGKGLAQKLVAQSARAIWDRGAIPMYLHGTHNAASARVAVKSGFPDRGWHIIEMG